VNGIFRIREACTHRLARTSGFTLIELMVAMVLGLIVIAGVTSVFLAGQQSFRTNSALADVQDSSRVAFELMARDMRQAGLTGCNGANGTNLNFSITNVLNNSGTAWWANWGNSVRGYDDATVDPALAGMPAPAASTSSVQLIGAATQPASTNTLYDGSNPEFVLDASAPALQAGDVAMVCTPGRAALFQVSAYAAGTHTVTFAASGNPGNSTTDLGCVTPAVSPNTYCFPPNSLLSRIQAVDWYIGANTAGGTSLYRVSVVNKAGVATPTPQEMVRGVTAMTITYLDPAVTAISNQFEPAAIIDTNSGWLGVTAVNVALTVDSTFQRASVTGNKPVERKYSFTTTLRNRVN
jgi:type IV pilus assembly protein PilW